MVITQLIMITLRGQIINTLVEANPFKDTGLTSPKLPTTMLVKLVGQGVNGLVEYNNSTLSNRITRWFI